MGKKHLFLMLSCILFAAGQIYAQVGINTENPNKLTDLEITNIANGTDTVAKGIMIPRMSEKLRDQIDVSDAKTANSLLIYNLDEDCYNYYSKTEKEWQSLCGKMGKSHFTIDCSTLQVFGKYGDGVALDASNYLRVSVTVTKIGSYSISASDDANPDNGYFFETSGTFYALGTFTISIPGTGQPINHTQGTDLVDPNDDTPDKFTLTSSGGGEDCHFEVNVRSTAARPEFTLDCASTVVEGMYFEDKLLSTEANPINGQSHRIKVTLNNIKPTSYGAVAYLETNTVDGISFKGEAVLTSPTQVVYLDGTGIPRGLSDKVMTITSNSESSTGSCQATVHMLIPRKRLMTLGNTTASYGYNLGLPTTRTNATTGYTSGNDLLTDKNNFGYNQWSIMKFAGFSNKGTAYTANLTPDGAAVNTWVDDDRDIVALNTSRWRAMTSTVLESFLKGTNKRTKVDIFMIGFDTEYFRDGNTDDMAKADLLIEFVKSGGILMICSEATISNGNFMNRFFGVSNISSVDGGLSNNPPGSLYTFGFDSDNVPTSMKPYYCKDNDPILTGPFEDISGRIWGEDASNTRYLVNLPLDEIIIYSGARPIGYTGTTNPAEGVTIFRHRDYPLVFVGDGGFNSNEVRTYTIGTTVCPFRLGTKTINGKTYTRYPVSRPNYGPLASSMRVNVYNSLFTANAFAWCILKAEEYRRNNK
ncbi:hypothetical protein LJC00_01195 [Dysgonomonas sp. OttesenSCG-928-M03]|nr:hypothetical protein [Dysgonomonas sp. OttesenSCG-928-M03]